MKRTNTVPEIGTDYDGIRAVLGSAAVGRALPKADGWPGVDMILADDGSLYVASTSNSADYPVTDGAYAATHPGGDILVICSTQSADFPTGTGSYCASRPGGRDLALARFSPDLTTLVAGTYLGSSSDDWPEAIVVSGENEIFSG